jgi:hypothetical protein
VRGTLSYRPPHVRILTVSMVAKRAVLAVLTVIGLVLLGVGSWFTFHLGPSGSATFTGTPAKGSVVVVEPSLLNRVDRPAAVTVVTRGASPVFVGRATPSDAEAVVGGADTTSVTGASVGSWSLVQARTGAGEAPPLAGADVWRESVEGKGRVRIQVSQENAPETIVVAGADGKPADISQLAVTIERRTWFFQALLVTLVGLLATAAGAAGLWQQRRGSSRPAPTTDPARPQEEASV